MATAADARQLWHRWTSNELIEYKEKWIAFRDGKVLANGSDLVDLSKPFADEIAQGNGPLFAFITLEVLQ